MRPERVVVAFPQPHSAAWEQMESRQEVGRNQCFFLWVMLIGKVKDLSVSTLERWIITMAVSPVLGACEHGVEDEH